MALRNRNSWTLGMMVEGLITMVCHKRFYDSSPPRRNRVDMKKLRPMILKRIENRAKEYPVKAMIPVAQNVLKSRSLLFQGVSTLAQKIPIWACKYCPEVYIGENGHAIRTCGGYRRRAKNQFHAWIRGTAKDILVPVETFHLRTMFQSVIKHEERFDYNRIPAVVELCCQAGVNLSDDNLHSYSLNSDGAGSGGVDAKYLSKDDLMLVARGTLDAWERIRSGVKKLLMVYPSKVCKYCSEVHVGPSGHKARLCGVFKYEDWRGCHFWEKANVDDLVPQKVVWFRRPQDPPILVDEGRSFYGHVPAVVDLCTKAGAIAPSKYNVMMKLQGLSAPTASTIV